MAATYRLAMPTSYRTAQEKTRRGPGCSRPARGLISTLSNQFLDHAGWFDAGQTLVEPLVAVAEPFVIETQQVQDRGMELVDVDRVFDDVVGEIVGLAVDRAGSRAAAGHPHGEAAGMMVAAVVFVRQATLRID